MLLFRKIFRELECLLLLKYFDVVPTFMGMNLMGSNLSAMNFEKEVEFIVESNNSQSANP